MNIVELHKRLNQIEMRRFKLWYNPEKLAFQDAMKAKLFADFPVYWFIHNQQRIVSAANRRDGHLDCAATLSVYSAVLDRACGTAANGALLKEIENFIEHVTFHNCTPIWLTMRDEAKPLLNEAHRLVEEMLEQKRWAA